MTNKKNERNELFLKACANGFSDVVDCMLYSGGIDLNYLDQDNHSALWFAVHGGHEDIVKQILRRGGLHLKIVQQAIEEAHRQKLNVLVQEIVEYPHTVYNNPKDQTTSLVRVCRDLRGFNFDVLTAAIKMGNFSLAENIIDVAEIYIDINADHTPFVSAIESGNMTLVKKLFIKKEVDINACGLAEKTPLFNAVSSPEIVKLLLTRENINIRRKDKKGNTVLIAAVQKNAFETVKLLVEYGGLKIDAVNKDAFCFLTKGSQKALSNPLLCDKATYRSFDVQPILGRRIPVGFYMKMGLTALQTAVALGYSDIALYLIEKAGARVDIPLPGGVPLLFLAIQNKMEEVVDALLQRLSPEELNKVYFTPKRITALHVAFKARALNIFRKLLNTQIDVNFVLPPDDAQKQTGCSILKEVFCEYKNGQNVYDYLVALLQRPDLDTYIYANFPYDSRTVHQVLEEEYQDLLKYRR